MDSGFHIGLSPLARQLLQARQARSTCYGYVPIAAVQMSIIEMVRWKAC